MYSSIYGLWGWEVKGYGYRWLVESVFSSIKRTMGATYIIKE